MKKYILLTLLITFSITLFGQTPAEQAEQIAYKHESNTIFAIKEGKKFHAFKYDDSITYLGYVIFDGKPPTKKAFPFLDAETDKHMSESYFFIVEDDVYYLFYKSYMGDAKQILSNKLVKPKNGLQKAAATSLGGVLKEDVEIEPTPESNPKPKDNSDDDDSGGVAWWIWAIGGWFAFRLFFGDD